MCLFLHLFTNKTRLRILRAWFSILNCFVVISNFYLQTRPDCAFYVLVSPSIYKQDQTVHFTCLVLHPKLFCRCCRGFKSSQWQEGGGRAPFQSHHRQQRCLAVLNVCISVFNLSFVSYFLIFVFLYDHLQVISKHALTVSQCFL